MSLPHSRLEMNFKANIPSTLKRTKTLYQWSKERLLLLALEFIYSTVVWKQGELRIEAGGYKLTSPPSPLLNKERGVR